MSDLMRRPKQAAALKRGRREDRGPLTEYLAFLLAGDVYAAPVSLVREILKPPPLTPVPRAPHATLGIVSVRGQLVTVIDLRRKLRLAEAPITRRARILLVDATEGEVMGVYVDEVLQVHRLSEGEIEPATTALGGEVAGSIVGIARPTGVFGAAALNAPPGRGLHPGPAAFDPGAAPAPGGRARPLTTGALAYGPDAAVIILLDLRAVLTS